MEKDSTIIITGAAGFIGSCMAGYLNGKGFYNLVLADDFSRPDKTPNLEGKQFIDKVERENLFSYLQDHPAPAVIFHLGARTDTTEFDYSIHERLNVEYSKKIWNYCMEQNVPLIYASSAATYGDGSKGYVDDHDLVNYLEPLNPYGRSKNEFDKWALAQAKEPPSWAGLKFFNVYGPNEYHKGRMASVIFHASSQIRNRGYVELFRSHREGYEDGGQLRDFIYVKDILRIMFWLMENLGKFSNGIYNAGTGKARSFADLARATFNGFGLAPDIRYIDMPEDLRGTYQYFTEADMAKLRAQGYDHPFYSLEEGVKDYVCQYLTTQSYY